MYNPPKRRGRPPGSKNKPKGPEEYAMTDTEEVPVPKPTGRSRAPKEEEKEVIPVPKARPKSRPKKEEEKEVIPVPKARSRSRAKPAEEKEEVPVPKPKAKARARTLSLKPFDHEEVIPVPPPVKKPRGRSRKEPPAEVEPPEVVPQLEKKTPGRKPRVSLVKIAADIGGDSSVPAVGAQVAQKTPGRKVPEAAPETRKPRAKSVDVGPPQGVNKDGTMKKRRGRPPGSKNKPKALVETVAALKA